MVRSESETSVWISWAVSNCYWTSLGHADKGTVSNSSSQLHSDPGCWEETLPVPDTEKAHGLFWVTVFNRYPRSPWVRLLLSRTQHRTFKTASCDTPVILDNCPWESQWTENQTIFSIITGRILVGMIACIGLRWWFVYSGGSQLNWINTNALHCLCGN